MIAPVKDIEEAREAAQVMLKDNLIPVFEVHDVEVTRNNDVEMVVYCESLKRAEDRHEFGSNDQESCIKENSLAVIKIKGTEEMFASQDLVEH